MMSPSTDDCRCHSLPCKIRNPRIPNTIVIQRGNQEYLAEFPMKVVVIVESVRVLRRRL